MYIQLNYFSDEANLEKKQNKQAKNNNSNYGGYYRNDSTIRS